MVSNSMASKGLFPGLEAKPNYGAGSSKAWNQYQQDKNPAVSIAWIIGIALLFIGVYMLRQWKKKK